MHCANFPRHLGRLIVINQYIDDCCFHILSSHSRCRRAERKPKQRSYEHDLFGHRPTFEQHPVYGVPSTNT